ncbi:shikimate dehydrogenase [Corynebacterium sp. HS2168-gen11]|uniref:shikimate dehydrogenase n=1 Tax=Corynebacterium sp. HS2168-gen11 TaxID=2974027 RepID=UPI00216AD302|nr:shikimate dehydrogenase [Corynebacterium sp. HS2168-gen11]MCS4535172.1 shikimate dehydrogenase [Corynebacterium sp. HS2168-gen11]
MPQAAVLGSPIAHSRSPLIHTAGYRALGLDDWSYTAHECTAEQLPAFVRQAPETYRGFSVTMPAKFAALAFADTVSDKAALIGSANTLVRTADGWFADNTDCEGALGALQTLELALPSTNSSAVIIGAGGTARPVFWALAQLGFSKITIVNRSDRRAEFIELAHALGVTVDCTSFDDATVPALIEQSSVVVNTVPAAGIAAYTDILAQAPVFDVIYDPFPTPLMQTAAQRGFPVAHGYHMLVHQALGQFLQFTGQATSFDVMYQALELPSQYL